MKTYENSAPVNHVGMTSSSVKNLFSALVQDLLFVKVYEVENRKELIDTITLIRIHGRLAGSGVGELFPRIGFIVTNLNLEAHKVITIYNGRAEIENRIKEGKNTLRWDKTSCDRFAANQARLLVGCLAYNLLHMVRDAAFRGGSAHLFKAPPGASGGS